MLLGATAVTRGSPPALTNGLAFVELLRGFDLGFSLPNARAARARACARRGPADASETNLSKLLIG